MPSTLRVVTLNIGSLLEPDWDRRRHEIVAWIDRLDPDVLCLQEVTESRTNPNTAGWIAEAASHQWHWAFGGDTIAGEIWSEAETLFGSAVLSRWPIEHTGYHRLETAGADPLLDAVPWELFGVRTAGLDLFSTHLAPAPDHGLHRRHQVVQIDRIITQARGDRDEHVFGRRRQGMPPILCGDFNAEPDSDEIRFLAGLTAIDGRVTFYQDAWRIAGDGPGLTNDWRRNPYCAGLNVHPKRIDYVFVGDGFVRQGNAGRVIGAQVVADEPITGISASDHFGVLVEIVWPDRP